MTRTKIRRLGLWSSIAALNALGLAAKRPSNWFSIW